MLETAKEVALTVIFTSLYVVGVITLAPISYSFFQVRISDALMPLSIIFGWPMIIGMTLGAIVTNFFGGLGIIDVLGGAIANFIATFLAWKIGRMKFKGSWIYAIAAEIFVVSIIVGTYLSYLFSIPLEVGLFGVFIGSLIAIGFLGYLLLRWISKPLIVKALANHIRLYLKDKS